MAVNKKDQNNKDSRNLGDSLLDSWTNSLNTIHASQKEVENVSIQAIGYQREVWEKLTEDFTRIEQEQKKLVEELRVVGKKNVQTLYGEEAGETFDKWNEHFDEVSLRVQQLTVTPLKETFNLLNQSQDQLQDSIKKGITQQQSIRENFLNQMKSAQKGFVDLVESNTKLALSLYKI